MIVKGVYRFPGSLAVISLFKIISDTKNLRKGVFCDLQMVDNGFAFAIS